MRLVSPLLVVSLLCVALPAAATTARLFRTNLEQDRATRAAPLTPRLIRSSLDDVPSHTGLPLEVADGSAPRIRISLDEGSAPYGQLSPTERKARRVRMTLD